MRDIDRAGGHSHFVADDFIEHYAHDPNSPESKHHKLRPSLVLQCFTNRRLFRELLAAWPNKEGSSRFGIFEIHAGLIDSGWCFWEMDKSLGTVQSWIDRFDGQFSAIMILACNPNDSTIHSERSLVFHPNKALNLPTALSNGHMRIFVPGHGYMENNHKKLRRLIDKLCSSNPRAR